MAEPGHAYVSNIVNTLILIITNSTLILSDDNFVVLDRHFRMGAANTRH